jgi:hypothetical protein
MASMAQPDIDALFAETLLAITTMMNVGRGSVAPVTSPAA